MPPPQQRGGQAADVVWLLSDEALEIGRRAVEDELVELRDARIGQLRNNGLVVKERDGSPSDIIRLGPEDALRIGLRAMLTSAPPAPSVGGWMPIETAPKDEPILVGPTKRMNICVAMNHSRDGWVTETCSEWISIYTPTHWMPLPSPPTPEGKP